MSARRKIAKGAKKRRSSVAPKPDKTEAQIISGCVRYLAATGGANACFTADSTGDSKYAATVAGKLMDEARDILSTFAGKPATSAGAIKAKARVALPMMDKSQHAELSGVEYGFLRLFLREVADFVTPQADAAWREGKRAKRGAKAA